MTNQAVARCTITGAAHGYEFEGELQTTADGRLLRRWRNAFGPPLAALALEELVSTLDLAVELARLRREPVPDRPNHRIARLEISVGSDSLVVSFPRPLIGDVQTEHPVDRLFAAIFGWPSANRPEKGRA